MKGNWKAQTSVACPVCGVKVHGTVPPGGDGRHVNLDRHAGRDGGISTCDGEGITVAVPAGRIAIGGRP